MADDITNRKIGRGTGYGSGKLPKPKNWNPGGGDSLYVQKLNRFDDEYDMESNRQQFHNPDPD